MPDRRYSEDEVSAIFRAAAGGGEESRALSRGQPSDGLTMRDLQAIADEVGIAPDALMRAAESLDRVAAPAVTRRVFGLPVGVERTVPLSHTLSDAEWDQLVVVLRETFGSTGIVTGSGSLREWRNGNLHALLEPTPYGQQLRMRTTNGAAQSQAFLGAAGFGMSAFIGVISALSGKLGRGIPVAGVFAVVGVVFITMNALRLPGWARLRRAQMDEIAGLLLERDSGG